MNRVKYVPADEQAREKNPGALLCIIISDAKTIDLWRAQHSNQPRFATRYEADKQAAGNGWVALSTLSAKQQARWLKAHRNARSNIRAAASGT